MLIIVSLSCGSRRIPPNIISVVLPAPSIRIRKQNIKKKGQSMRKRTRFIAALMAVLMLIVACPAASAATPAKGSSSAMIAAALGELGYREQAKGYTKFGKWFQGVEKPKYSVTNAAWCDMFVSWCADQAGLSTAEMPRSASCTTHVAAFKNMGRYRVSAARGGNYTPQQGDLIFFYDSKIYPSGNRLRHVGIVLYTEGDRVFTIEGNTATTRLDLSQPTVKSIKDGKRPTDYVLIKHYSLNDADIHGYGIPAFRDRTPYPISGYIDLDTYKKQSAQFSALNDAGIMKGTSAHTFSPAYGMTRGEFLKSLMSLYNISGYDIATQSFSDVPQGSTYYDAVMTARTIGIIYGAGDNTFQPNVYISGTAAQALIDRVRAVMEQGPREFSFPNGELSSAYSPAYTTRAAIAAAFFELRSNLSRPVETNVGAIKGTETVPLAALSINHTPYISERALLEHFPEMTVTATDPAQVPHSSLVFTNMLLYYNNRSALTSGLIYQGTRYISVYNIAAALPLTVTRDTITGNASVFFNDLPENNDTSSVLPPEPESENVDDPVSETPPVIAEPASEVLSDTEESVA